MSAEPRSDDAARIGIRSRLGWPIGGALGGAVGAVAFGVLVWLFDPRIVEVTIPAIYGLRPGTLLGWGIHLLHGIVLGIVFGYLVTRPVLLDVIEDDVETRALSETDVAIRLVGVGFVFGLAVWAILPLLVLPVWAQAIDAPAAGEFPSAATRSLVGHVVFGTVLGIVFAATIDLDERQSADAAGG